MAGCPLAPTPGCVPILSGVLPSFLPPLFPKIPTSSVTSSMKPSLLTFAPFPSDLLPSWIFFSVIIAT